MATPLLQVADLQTHFLTFRGSRVIKAVDRVSFALNDGETLGLVGESGCGKTTTCLSLVGLLPTAGRIVGGSISFEGEDLVRLTPRAMRRIRGRRIAMILQDPMASLNPLFTIYRQVAEPAFFHQHLRGRSLKERVRSLLGAVRIPSPAARMREYPHQMSGGMRQRIVGAIALSGGPKLIIADEPTTNLDVTIQAQYLDLLKELQRETGVALIFVTHDLGIVAKMCDKVAVMYAGKIVEYRDGARSLFRSQAPLYQGPAWFGAEARQQSPSRNHPWPTAESGQLTAGVPFSSALCCGDATMLAGRAQEFEPWGWWDGALLAHRPPGRGRS